MDASLGRITARLAENEEKISSDLVDLINENINPPAPVGPEDVHIRTLFIVSDRVNSFGGRFPVEEHARLAELLVDSPVMVGHRKDRLPVGRNFHAVTVERDGRHWVKSYFYWLKSAEGADNLKENIDGGIYKECSIGFTFLFPECSVCGKDIRFCEHEPLQSYRQNGRDDTCFFNYRQIERVLETSLVYRGALPDTEISRELKMEKVTAAIDREKEPAVSLRTLADPDELDENGRFLIIPHYEAVPVVIRLNDNQPKIFRGDGQPFDEKFSSRFPLDQIFKNPDMLNSRSVCGRLVGYRGKERCSVGKLEKFISGGGSVSRAVLLLFPDENFDFGDLTSDKKTFEIKPLPYRYAERSVITERAVEIATRSGVEIWPMKNNQPANQGFLYRPVQNSKISVGRYTLTGLLNSTDARLRLDSEAVKETFAIKHFNRERLARGRRFIADKIDYQDENNSLRAFCQRGAIRKIQPENNSLHISLTGNLEGEFVIRPVKLEGQPRFLIYRITGN
ncbi:MAG: hypothetical protein JXA92_07245 [candidate division Zixibacteria bacterium]|nr:hypothetical protein [candidate division Zixibacteria bacterium]